ncbi:hypothetical protein D3Z52_22915, partial [Clostridiaceae bacterium]|nr:hypothetical protein [Clostridiaceae bacterium]
MILPTDQKYFRIPPWVENILFILHAERICNIIQIRAISEKLFTNSGKKRYNESEVKKSAKEKSIGNLKKLKKDEGAKRVQQ